jgi:hypothetical protein
MDKKEGEPLIPPIKLKFFFKKTKKKYKIQKKTNQMNTQQQEKQYNEIIKLQTYRFNFSNTFIKELEYFSKIHKYDDRKTFKLEWDKWIKDEPIKEMIEIEIEKSKKEDYEGNIMDKMFKSARYYYRKKKDNEPPTNENKEAHEKKEKNFTGLSKQIIQCMENHIHLIIREKLDENTKISKIDPSSAFTDFCNTHIQEITDEIFNLKNKMNLEEKEKEIQIKFKKSYKNKFYKIRVLLSNKP